MGKQWYNRCWIGTGRWCHVYERQNVKNRRRSVIIHQGNYTSIWSLVNGWSRLQWGHVVQISYRTYNSYHWSSISLSHHTKQNNEKIHNAITEVSKGDCIIMGDFNHGNIKWDTQQSTGIEDQKLFCLIQDTFLAQYYYNQPEQRWY